MVESDIVLKVTESKPFLIRIKIQKIIFIITNAIIIDSFSDISEDLIEKKFGKEAANNIVDMTKIKLKRKIKGD